MVKKTIAAIFSVLVLSTVLTACNTTRGVGEDISDGGNAISGAATKFPCHLAKYPFNHQLCRTTCKRLFSPGTAPILRSLICPGLS